MTSRGWTLLGGAVGLLAGSVLLGLVELAVLAVTALGVLVVSACRVVLAGPRLELAREVVPHRVSVGDDARVELTLTNRGTRAAPLLAVSDAFDGGRRSARFSVPPARPGASAHAAYRLPTGRRGRFRIGPLRLTLVDPFGFVRRRFRDDRLDEVVVLPRVHRISLLPEAPGAPVTADRARARHGQAGGREFRSLRDYVPGDDLRRIHWRSTARTGELMIREDEDRWQSHVALLLDVRRGAHDEASFELAVEAVASIASTVRRAGRRVQVATSAGDVIGREVEGRPSSLLEELASLTPEAHPPPGPLDAPLRRVDGAGTAVVVVGALGEDERAAIRRLTTRYRRVVAVLCRPSVSPAPHLEGALVVAPNAHVPFPAAWDRAVARWKRPVAAPR